MPKIYLPPGQVVLQVPRRTTTLKTLSTLEIQQDMHWCGLCLHLATFLLGDDYFCHAHAPGALAQELNQLVR